MNLQTVSMGTPINLQPSSVVEEVIQNVRMIMSTLIYTVPYDRTLAITGEYLDNPIQLNKALVQADIFNAIKNREPRAEVRNISFEGDALEGKLKPTVRILINE